MTTTSTKRDAQLQAEINARRAYGSRQVSLSELKQLFLDLGYLIWRQYDCHCVATVLNDGRRYPCTTTGLLEDDTRRTAWNSESRRDENYRKMQQLRNEVFAVVRGRIFEV